MPEDLSDMQSPESQRIIPSTSIHPESIFARQTGGVLELAGGFGSKKEWNDPENMNLRDLYNATYHEENEILRKNLAEQIKRRFDEAVEAGYFDKRAFKTQTMQTMRRSNWEVGDSEYFYTNMLDLGTNMENQAKSSYGKEVSKRHEGVYEIASELIANQASVQGVRKKFPDRDNRDWNWVAQKYVEVADDEEEAQAWFDERKKALEFSNITGFGAIDWTQVIRGRSQLETDAAWGHAPSQELLNQRRANQGSDEQTEIWRQILEEMQKQRRAQERVTVANIQGYDNFASILYNRSPMSPHEFYQRPPAWYEAFDTEQERQMIITLTNINTLAYIVKTNGMTNFDAIMEAQGIEIRKESLQQMWDHMPGYRIAFATIVNQVFEPNRDHFVISEQGYKIIENFKEYRNQLIISLAKHLEETRDPDVERFLLKPTKEADKYRIAAIAAVSAADNFLYACGAYHSGDEKRKVTNTDVWVEQPRAFFMPGIKGEKKWIKKEDPGREEDWGGVLGEFMQDKLNWNEEFRKLYEAGENGRYLPERLFYSLFDHQYFNKEYSERNFYSTGVVKKGESVHIVNQGSLFGSSGKIETVREKVNISEALVSSRIRNLRNSGFNIVRNYIDNKERDLRRRTKSEIINLNLIDYVNSDSIDFRQLDRGELHGDYADTRSHAVAIYKGLTTKDPAKTGLSTTEFIQELNKLRDDDLLQQLQAKDGSLQLWNRDFITIAVAIAACKQAGVNGECFVKGIDDPDSILLNIPDIIYDNMLFTVLKENRLYNGMPKNFKEYLYRVFYAKDPSKTSVERSDVFWAQRPRLRRRALANINRRPRGGSKNRY